MDILDLRKTKHNLQRSVRDKMKEIFNYFLFIGGTIGFIVEIANFKRSAGIGIICFSLIMILYYQMFPKERKK